MIQNFLHLGNEAFRNGNYKVAKEFYQQGLSVNNSLSHIFKFNLDLCDRYIYIHSSNEMHKHVFNVIDRKYDVFSRFLVSGGIEESEIEKLNKMVAHSKFLTNLKTEHPLVSVIMPTWNRAYIISQAIQSVLDQSYTNWELIICDDDSDDNTESIVKGMVDSRIRYYKLSKNNGAVARNHGIKHARGNILSFLDSDNIWHPQYLDCIVSAHLLKKSPVVYTGYVDAHIAQDKIISHEIKFHPFKFSKLAWRNYIDLNTLSFNVNCLKVVGFFDPLLERQQDWDLIVRNAAHYDFYGVDLPLVFYRRNDDWNQVTLVKKHINTRQVVLDKNKELVEKYKVNKTKIQNLDSLLKFDSTTKQLKKIAIKISAPSERVAHSWGDFHFAHQLGRALYKFGWDYEVHCQDAWYSQDADINLVIRGRHRFDVRKSNASLNLFWLISHPDRVPSEEYNDYDHIFIASDYYVNKVKKVTKKPVSPLLQAVDIDIFNDKQPKITLPKPIVFVGNSRKVYRPIVKWAIESNVDIAIWGKDWEEYIDDKYIFGQYIPNDKVSSYYGSCKILLNDHWESMANNGFISNRIFDASASGAFIISDHVRGLQEVFGDTIAVANSKDELVKLVEFYRDNDLVRLEKAQRAKLIVESHHTFQHRASNINDVILNISVNL